MDTSVIDLLRKILREGDLDLGPLGDRLEELGDYRADKVRQIQNYPKERSIPYRAMWEDLREVFRGVCICEDSLKSHCYYCPANYYPPLTDRWSYDWTPLLKEPRTIILRGQVF